MTPLPPLIDAAPGVLPPFWEDRSAVFFANLRSLFFGNAGGTQELVDAIEGIDSYGARLVPVINLLFRGGESVLVLERAPVPELLQYFVNGLGLVLPHVDVLPAEDYEAFCDPTTEAVPPAIEHIRSLDVPWIDGFVTDQRLVEVARALGRRTIASFEGSRDGNNKLLLHQHLASQGLPVFDTHLAPDATAVPDCAAALLRAGYRRAVIKSQLGASGIGLIRFATDDALPDLPDHLFHSGPAMVQGWLDETVDGVSDPRSPSVQMFLSDDRVHLYDITEQLLSDDSVHQGNLAPPPYLHGDADTRETMLQQAGVAGQWLHGRGYRGTASADFLLVRRGNRTEVRVCEVNARVTGATYPAVLARYFAPQGHWLMLNLRLRSVLAPEALLETLDEQGCLFLPGERRGVIPINLNLDAREQVTKGQFLCLAPDTAGCEAELAHAREVLPVDMDYDRD